MRTLRGRSREMFPSPEAVDGDELWLVEGAPDVLAAYEVGIAAVSIPGVGFARSAEQWAGRFTGRRVVVCLDGDADGRAAAATVARALARHAAEVRRVDLGHQDGYDLTDLLLEAVAASSTTGRRDVKELLERMVEVAPVVSPLSAAEVVNRNGPAPSADRESFYSSPSKKGRDERNAALPFAPLMEAIANVPEEPEWVWDGYLAPGSVSLLAGAPKVGKSTLSFGLLEALLQGRAFLGRTTRGSGVLLLSEERHSTLAEKARRFRLGGNVDLLMRHQVVGVDWPDVVGRSIDRCARRGLGVLVVDTWDKWTGLKGDEEKSAGPILAALEPLTRAAGSGLSVLIVAHTRKAPGKYGEAVRGSNALTGGVDIVMELERAASVDKGARVLKSVSRYASTPDELAATLEGGVYAACNLDVLKSKAHSTQLLEALVDAPHSTYADLTSATGIPRATVHKLLGALADQGQVVREGKGTRGDAHRWTIVSSRPLSLGDESNSEGDAAAAAAEADVNRRLASLPEMAA